MRFSLQACRSLATVAALALVSLVPAHAFSPGGDPGDGVTPVPEPSSVAAFAATGLVTLGLILKARKRKAD